MTVWLSGGSSEPLELGGNAAPWQMILGMAVMMALLIGVYLLLRWLSGKRGGGMPGGGRYLKIVERLPVGQNLLLAVVQAGQQLVLLSVSRDRCTYICDLTPGSTGSTANVRFAGPGATESASAGPTANVRFAGPEATESASAAAPVVPAAATVVPTASTVAPAAATESASAPVAPASAYAAAQAASPVSTHTAAQPADFRQDYRAALEKIKQYSQLGTSESASAGPTANVRFAGPAESAESASAEPSESASAGPTANVRFAGPTEMADMAQAAPPANIDGLFEKIAQRNRKYAGNKEKRE